MPPLEGVAPTPGTSSPQPADPLGSSNPLGSLLDSNIGDLKPVSLDSDMGGIKPMPLDSDMGDIKPMSLDSDVAGVGLSGLGALEDDGAVPGVAAIDPLGDASVAPPLTKEEPKPEPEKVSASKSVFAKCSLT